MTPFAEDSLNSMFKIMCFDAEIGLQRDRVIDRFESLCFDFGSGQTWVSCCDFDEMALILH